jgi:serine/threonine-protein kinase
MTHPEPTSDVHPALPDESGVTPNRAPKLLALQASVRSLGRYRLIGEISRGGMGIIYLGVVQGPAGFSKLFAIKELRVELASDPQAVALFLEEAKLVARMSHPNVAQTFEVGSQDDHHFIGMEYLDGQPLARVLERCKSSKAPLPPGYAINVVSGVLDGLHYAHTLTDYDGSARGIVHRDVSPHNVFVTFDGDVKVLDFGVAKAVDSGHKTETGVLKGKVAYMSPEQALGEPVDARSDVFAVGAMLWEALAGRRRWADVGNDVGILRCLINGAIPDLHVMAPDVAPELQAIVERAMAVNPGERFASAAEMRAALDAYAEQAGLDKYGAREVAKLTAQLFETERADMKARIDRELKLLQHGGASGELPMLVEGARAPVTASHSQDVAAPDASSSAQRAYALAGEGRGSRWKGLGAVFLVALAGAATARFAFQDRAAPARSAASALSPATSTAAPIATVAISIAVTPGTAQVFVDDQAAAGNPAAFSPARDDQVHHVRAEAPGYQSAQVDVTFDRDRGISLALVPAAPATATVRPHAAPLPTARPNVRKKDDLEPF